MLKSRQTERNMRQIILGKTGIKTKSIGFGGIPVQRVNEDEAVNTVVEAVKLGVNYFDSARGYTVSESFIGKALKQIGREKVVLASKAPPVDYDGFESEVKKSLDAFDTSYIDLYQLHNVKTFKEIDLAFSEKGAYKAFEKLKKEGKVLHFGITAHKREVLEYAIEKYGEKIETIMFPYNIVENQGVEMFRQAKKAGIGTIAMKPLGGGNIDDISLALRYVLQNDFIDIAIPGMGNIDECRADTSFSDLPLTDEEKAKCEQIKNELGNDFCRRCSYCAPCTAGIDIPGIFTLQVYLKKYGLGDWAKSRYAAMKKTAADCIECGECEKRCPYNLDIIKRMREIKEIFEK